LKKLTNVEEKKKEYADQKKDAEFRLKFYNDVLIIDQPEDDLDNQTIYEDVIKLIRNLKPQTQFVFATHNANFPVLGDAEQILACSYSDDSVHVNSGSIDCPTPQQEIVDIMEGGEEAFRQRRRRYEIWIRTASYG
jgi:chromosome segregation protein